MPPASFKDIIQIFIDLIKLAVPAVATLALLLFLWGAASLIFNRASEDAVRAGKQKMFWGVIALFVMLSVWGLSFIVINTFLGADYLSP